MRCCHRDMVLPRPCDIEATEPSKPTGPASGRYFKAGATSPDTATSGPLNPMKAATVGTARQPSRRWRAEALQPERDALTHEADTHTTQAASSAPPVLRHATPASCPSLASPHRALIMSSGVACPVMPRP